MQTLIDMPVVHNVSKISQLVNKFCGFDKEF